MLLCTSTETVQTVGDRESSDSVGSRSMLLCTSTETVRTIGDRESSDSVGCVRLNVAVRPQRPYRLLGTGRALTRWVQGQCCYTCPQRPYGLLIRDVESNDSVGRTSVR